MGPCGPIWACIYRSRTKELIIARRLITLSKPRIIVLLVLTALCGSWKAAGGSPDWATLSVVAGAGTLAAAGANTINQGIDADIDAVMRRTRSRPVPSKEIGPRVAIGIGSLFVSLAVGTMWLAANPLAGQLTLAAAVVYVFVYSLMMKRKSWNNIVIGGAAGAFPRGSRGRGASGRAGDPSSRAPSSGGSGTGRSRENLLAARHARSRRVRGVPAPAPKHPLRHHLPASAREAPS